MDKNKVAAELVKLAKELVSDTPDYVLQVGDILPKQKENVLNKLSTMSLSDISALIAKDHRANGKQVNFAAKPYLSALYTLNTIDDDYGMDSGSSIVAYLLGNLTSWRGEVAKAVKLELNKRLKRAR